MFRSHVRKNCTKRASSLLVTLTGDRQQHKHFRRLLCEPLEDRRLLNGAADKQTIQLFDTLPAPLSSSPLSASLENAYGQLPISFEVNEGQTDPGCSTWRAAATLPCSSRPTAPRSAFRRLRSRRQTLRPCLRGATGVALAMQLVGAARRLPSPARIRCPAPATT